MNIKEAQDLLNKTVQAGNETCDYPLVRLKQNANDFNLGMNRYFILMSLDKAETTVYTGTYRAARTKTKEVNVVWAYAVKFDVAKNTFKIDTELRQIKINFLEDTYTTVEKMCNGKHKIYMDKVSVNDLKSRVLGIPVTSTYSERTGAGNEVAKRVLEALGLPANTRKVFNTDSHFATNTHAGITITLSFEQIEELLKLKATV